MQQRTEVISPSEAATQTIKRHTATQPQIIVAGPPFVRGYTSVVDSPYGTDARTKDMKVTLQVDRDRASC